jgi:hypothetical protein
MVRKCGTAVGGRVWGAAGRRFPGIAAGRRDDKPGIFFLAKKKFSVKADCSLKGMDVVHPSSQSNAREPGENPGRLRHCNGYKFPEATGAKREGGKAV